MDKRFHNQAQNPRRSRNLEDTCSSMQDFQYQNSFDSEFEEAKMSRLIAENTHLKAQLKDAEYHHKNVCYKYAAADKKVTELKTKLNKARSDLLQAENKAAALESQLEMAKQKKEQQSANATAEVSAANQRTKTEDKDTSELILQLQTAHEDLDKFTLKRQSSEDLQEGDEQEHQQKVRAVKTGILSLSEKLQQEQAALMKKAAKMYPCTGQSAQDESSQAEKINFHMQKLQTSLLNQALSLNTVCKEKKASNKFKWVRSHREQEQQTDELDETAASQTAADVEKDLQRIKEESQAELERSRSSFTADLESLKLVNTELAAAQKNAQEELQQRQKEWQEERSSLLDAIQLLHKTLKKKEEKWTERESCMAYRMEELESKMEEMLEKKAKKKRGWLRRMFTCSSSN